MAGGRIGRESNTNQAQKHRLLQVTAAMFATLLTLIVLATSIASGIAGVAAAMAACYHRPTIRQLTRAVATLVAIGLGAWVVVAMANTSLLVALAGTMVIVTATIGATIQFGAAFLIGKLTRFQQS